jgi:LacI family transcriptional regulator
LNLMMAQGIRALAQELDLSITTVSRALAGYSDVAEVTRVRVAAAAAALGYRPNASARRLKTGRSDTVGFLLPMNAGGFSDPFLAELMASIGARLAESDIDLLVCPLPEGPGECAAIRRLVDGRKVDGVILPRTRLRDQRVELLMALDIPFITHGRTVLADAHPWLDVDSELAFREAADRLIAAGHRRIGLINSAAELAYAGYRRAGYEAALRAAGLSCDDLILEAAPGSAMGAPETHRLLDLPSPPTALLCATDRIAIGALSALSQRGLTAGRDVSVIGYDDLPFAANTHPPLTTMRQPIAAEGRELVDMLARRIAGAPVAELQTLWRASWVARQTVGPPPDSRS